MRKAVKNRFATQTDEYHPKKAFSEKIQSFSFASEKEETSEFWKVKGQAILEELLSRKDNTNHAKNVILFLGDGMSFPTVAATRAYMGGEEEELSFEKFPYTGFSKVRPAPHPQRLDYLY